MIFGSFIHGDNNIFRTTVSEFVNDTNTHPIIKYKAFIGVFLLVISGIAVLTLLHGSRISGHSSLKHLFVPVSDIRNKYTINDDDNIFDYEYSNNKYNDNKSGAAIFREAIEGFDVNTIKEKETPKTKDGKATDKNGEFVSSDVKGMEKEQASKKNNPCATDCGNYIELKSKINELSKMVDEVKSQKDSIKQTSDAIQALGTQIEDLNKTLSPGGQVEIQL